VGKRSKKKQGKEKKQKISPLCAQRERDRKKKTEKRKREKEKNSPLCRPAGAIRMPFDELIKCVVLMN
jgi:hypothetical protein